AQAQRNRVVVDLFQMAGNLERLHDLRSGFKPVQTTKLLRYQLTRQSGIQIDDRRHGKVVTFPDLEVRWVVCRRDLERAGSELHLHGLIRNDRYPPVGERNAGFLALNPFNPFVSRVHRDSAVSEDRLWAHRGDSDLAAVIE